MLVHNEVNKKTFFILFNNVIDGYQKQIVL